MLLFDVHRDFRLHHNFCFAFAFALVHAYSVTLGLRLGLVLELWIVSVSWLNDLPEICEQFVRVYLFADAAKLFKHVICDEDHKALQFGLNALQDWYKNGH